MAVAAVWVLFAFATLSHGVRPAKEHNDVKPSEGASVTAAGHLQKQREKASAKQNMSAQLQGRAAADVAAEEASKAERISKVRSFLKKLKPAELQQLKETLTKMKPEHFRQLQEGKLKDDNPVSMMLDGDWTQKLMGIPDSAKDMAYDIMSELGIDHDSRLDDFLTQEDADKSNAPWPGHGTYTAGFENYFNSGFHRLTRPFEEHAKDMSARSSDAWRSMDGANHATNKLHGALKTLNERAQKADSQTDLETRTVADLSQNGFQAYNDYVDTLPPLEDNWRHIGEVTQEQLLSAGKHHIQDGRWDFFQNELAETHTGQMGALKNRNDSWIYNTNLHEDDGVDYRGGDKLEDAIHAEERAFESSQEPDLFNGSPVMDNSRWDQSPVSTHGEMTFGESAGESPTEQEHLTGASTGSNSDAVDDDGAFS